MWHSHDDGEEIKREISNAILIRWIATFLTPHSRILWIVLPIMLASIALQWAVPGILKVIIDQNIMGESLDGLVKWLGLYVLSVIISLILGYIYKIMLSKVGLRIVTTLKKNLFRHVVNLDLKFFEDYPPGVLIARIESDTEKLRQLFTDVAFSILQMFIFFLGVVVILIIENAKVALVVLTVVPVLMIMTFFFLKFIRKFYQAVREKYAQLISFVTEFVQGVDIIQLYNYDNHAMKRLQEKNLGKYRIEKAAAFYEYGFWGIFFAAEVFAIMIALSSGSKSIMMGTMTIGTMIMFLEYIRKIFIPLMMFSEQLNFIQRALVSAERVYKILHIKSRIVDPEEPSGKPSIDREIKFENVSFAYEEENYAIRNINFTIKSGVKVALVGASGGGKSTIVNLLCRFYDPSEGRILADGVDIRSYTEKEWREMIGLVLQDVYLFPGTIADNLRVMDQSIPLSRIEQAAGIVRADEFIRKMKQGYQSELAERGANLSVGERQLLSFARALSFDPPLLILDEATSSVDPQTEKLIQDGIDQLLKGRTSLVVAHRLSTILNSDRIIVVDKGMIVEQGSHAELIKKDGLYKHLYDLQFAGAIVDDGGEISGT